MIYLLTGACILAAFIVLLLFLRRNARKRNTPDGMEGHDFEYYCAELLRGADILAEKEGVTYAVQCKCYNGPVGVPAVQEVYAGAAFYDRMVGVVMTNTFFTAPAVTIARKLNVLLWDREYLEQVLGGGR